MTQDTGGQFFQSPTTAAEIQRAFAQAYAAITGAPTLSSVSGEVAISDTGTEEFVVDSTIESADIVVSYQGTTGDVSVSLVKLPAGTGTGVNFNCEAGGSSVSCVATLDSGTIATHGTGSYQVRLVNISGTQTGTSVIVLAKTKDGADGGTYVVSIGSANGNIVQYPQPIVLSVTITRNLPITGVTVAATITDPSGNEQTVDLNDDGVGADQYDGDGLYSAWAPYTNNGTYAVRVAVTNPDGSARRIRMMR